MDGLQQELLSRLPLVEAVYQLLSHVLHEPLLDQVYEQHRGRSYEGQLTFARFVYLLRDALMLHNGSGRAAFQAAEARGELPVAGKNVYEKLGGCPLPLSLALVRTGAQRLGAILAPPEHDPLPKSLAKLAVMAIDGKKLKKAAKRLLALRGLPGKMLATKLLVALDLRRRLVQSALCFLIYNTMQVIRRVRGPKQREEDRGAVCRTDRSHEAHSRKSTAKQRRFGSPKKHKTGVHHYVPPTAR